MQFRYLDTIQNPEHMEDGKFQKVTAMAYSPNSMRLAVATQSRRIFLYNDEGKEMDRFNTKPSIKNGPRNYIIRDVAFSPDSTRLAVAQSDNIVFIYKLGSNWGDKKTICNKFFRKGVSVTCMCWPAKRPNEIVFGLMDGQVMVGVLKNNKAFRLFSCDSYVVSIAPSPSGHGFVCGHLDGKVHQYTFKDPNGKFSESSSMLFKTSFVPYCLSHGAHIVVAGNTGQVQFYKSTGEHVQTFTHTLQPTKDDSGGNALGSESRSSIKEFSVAKFNPTGHTAVIGNFSCFFTFVFNPNSERWDEAPITHVDNLYTVTALAWKPDGSKLTTGSLCGAVDMYDACIRRFRYRGRWEFTYTSSSSLVVKTIRTGDTVSVSSKFKYEITKSDIYSERFFVGRTPETLILGDLETKKMSEIHWSGAGKEKFFFDNPTVCMVFNSGELSLVQYGDDELIGQVRTEHMNPHLISTRISDSKEKVKVKKVAFLLDEQSVRIMDLDQKYGGGQDVTVSHDTRVDWLELNVKATKLLFRDRRRTLHLFDVETETRTTLLNFCDYVQWVPRSDAVVAQSRNTLYVWYRIEQTDSVVTREIKGDIEEIERDDEKTMVIFNEGMGQTMYRLDEDLIAFDTALDDLQLESASQILEMMDKKTSMDKKASQKGKSERKQKADHESISDLGDREKSRDSMWGQLAESAIQLQNFAIAERCYAALGDISKVHFMNKLNQLKQQNGQEHYLVQAQIAIFKRQFKKAEAIYMDNGRIDCTLNMYRRLFKWNDALNLARSQNHPSVSKLTNEYFDYLISTKQQEIAGDLKEQEGDYMTALHLYLQGGYPAKAAKVVTQQHLTNDNQLLEKVAEALLKNEMFNQAGKFLEKLNYTERSLKAYLRGHNYRDAVDLCRRVFPERVVQLQESWGDHLARLGQMDAACGHYIEAGCNMKAINAAIEAKQWKKAIQGLDNLDEKVAQPYYKRIAQHYETIGEHELAEKYFIQGQLYMNAVRMYFNIGFWEKAHGIALTYMGESEVSKIYIAQARQMESQGKLKDACQLYLKVNEPDLAINMFKKQRKYNEMIDLVSRYRKEHLNETHITLAKQFERENNNFKQAEHHFLAAGMWKLAVDMYREQEMWEDALRVAKKGGIAEYKKTAFFFAISVGGEAGIKFLTKRGLGELAVQYAIENGEYTEAFHIAEKSCKAKLPEVHYQYALALEDEGHFERAEEEFIKASKPKEAIDMYTHQRQWEDAMRVASQHDPISITSIYEEQGRVAIEQKNYKSAENFFINAKKPQMAIKMYKDANEWDRALRVAKNHVPHLVSVIEMEHNRYMTNVSDTNSLEYHRSQAKILQQSKKYSEAIDTYLRLDQSICPDQEELSTMLETACDLANNYVRQRSVEVATAASGKLQDLGMHKKAAKVLQDARAHKQAIEVLMKGNLFDLAKQEARKSAPNMLKIVDQAHQKHLMQQGNTDKLSQINPSAAIDMYAKKGDWNKVYKLAAKQGRPMVLRCATMHAESELKKGNPVQAVGILKKQGVKVDQNTIGTYVKICKAVLSDGAVDSKNHESIVPDSHIDLREVMYKMVSEAKAGGLEGHKEFKKLDKCLRAAHFSAIRRRCEESKLSELVMKQCVSLLRFTDIMPVDVAFYHAGSTSKKNEQADMAFVFFNRFVDITDLIEDEDGDIDESEFLNTDIPRQLDIPKKSHFDEETRDDIREWALTAGMSNEVNNELPTRKCGKCGKKTYLAAVTCHNCKHASPECIVTGWPVFKSNSTSCPSCNKLASKDAWNSYVMKNKCCPWCEKKATPVY